MENVPRVANVLITESQKGGQLHEFKKIIDGGFVEVLNMREFGSSSKEKKMYS